MIIRLHSLVLERSSCTNLDFFGPWADDGDNGLYWAAGGEGEIGGGKLEILWFYQV